MKTATLRYRRLLGSSGPTEFPEEGEVGEVGEAKPWGAGGRMGGRSPSSSAADR